MPYSFQLYSARNADLDATLRLLSQIGYSAVEGFGGVFGDPQGLRRKLDGLGLAMPTAHFGLDLLAEPNKALDIAGALGIGLVVCPYIVPNERPTDAAGWRRFGERLARLSEPVTRAGLGFAYNNHDFEFVPTGGKLPMDEILAGAPQMGVEADIAWIDRGGADAAAWLRQNGSRVVAVHVKDIAPAGENAGEDGWADVGHGRMAWASLLDTVKTHTAARHFIVEHDNPSDVERFARRSFASLQSWGL
jgi:sugar phosphate isomerase/epimerase